MYIRIFEGWKLPTKASGMAIIGDVRNIGHSFFATLRLEGRMKG